MGKVNVVLPDGTVTAVDEDLYLKAKDSTLVRRELAGEEYDRGVEADREEGTVGGTIAAGLLGAADTVTFGGASGFFGTFSDHAANVSGGEDELEALKADHSTAYGVGAVAGAFTPWGAPGLAAGAGRLVEAGLAARAINPLTRGAAFGARAAGRGVEGAIMGIDGELVQTQLTGDPLTIEGFIEEATIGGIMNVGVGALADGLMGMGRKARASIADEDAFRAELRVADEGRAVFDHSGAGDAYKGMREAVESVDDTFTKDWKAVEKDNDVWDDFLSSPKRWGQKQQEFRAAQNKIREEFVQGKASPTVAKEAASSYKAQNPLPTKPAKPDLEDLPKEPKPHKVPETPSRSAAGMSALDELKVNRAQAEANDVMRHYNTAKTLTEKRNAKALAEYEKALKDYEKATADWKVGLDSHVKASVEAARIPKGVTPEQQKLSQAFLKHIDDEVYEAEKMWRGGLKAEATGRLHEISRKLQDTYGARIPIPEVPKLPRPRFDRPAYEPFPDTLEKLSRARPETIARLASRLEPEMLDGPLGRLVDELGLERLGDTRATFAALHERLSKYAKVIDKFEAQRVAEEIDATKMGRVGRFMRKVGMNAVRSWSGYRAFDVAGGGAWGALMGGAARTVATSGMTYVGAKIAGLSDEDASTAAMFAGAKAGLGSKIRSLVAKYADPGARALNRLGPVTSVLTTRFDGTEDKEKDIRKATLNRIRDVIAAAQNAADTGYVAVSGMGLLGHPADLGFKIQSHYVRALQHLADTAPKDPGIGQKFGGDSDWLPSWSDLMAWAHRFEAVVDPLRAIARQISGEGHPAANETLWYTSPAIVGLAAEELVYEMPQMRGIAFERAGGPAGLLGLPTGLQHPQIVTAIQGQYMKAPPEQQQQGSGNPVGRPAAVQSKVAGSSVSGLISQ